MYCTDTPVEEIASWVEANPSEVERLRRGTMTTAFDTARERVRNTPKLAPHEEFILADWPEGDEHWQWVAEAPVEEIVSWVEAGTR